MLPDVPKNICYNTLDIFSGISMAYSFTIKLEY